MKGAPPFSRSMRQSKDFDTCVENQVNQGAPLPAGVAGSGDFRQPTLEANLRR